MKTQKVLIGMSLIMSFIAMPVHAQDWLTNGLVSYYPFNGNANDESGNGNNGMLNGGTTYSTDRFGVPDHAVRFVTNTDIICTSKSFDNPQVFSTSVWFATASTNEGALLGFDDGQCSHIFHWDRYTWLNASGNLVFYVYNGSEYCVTAESYNNGLWHQAVSVLSSNGMQLYVDGILRAQNSSVTSGQAYTGYWRVGGLDYDGGLAAMIGSVGDIRIFNRALSANEVAQLYALEAPPATIGIRKAVYLEASNLRLGTNYQLQISSDLNTWTNTGSAFTATNSIWRSTNYWDVDWNQLYFRFQIVP
jgi:hypothetical protein